MGADIDQVRSVAVLVQPAANLGLRLDPAARALPRAPTRSSRSGTESSQTRRWRGPDSNSRSHRLRTGFEEGGPQAASPCRT